MLRAARRAAEPLASAFESIDGIEDAAVRSTWRRLLGHASRRTQSTFHSVSRLSVLTVCAQSWCSACMPNASEWSPCMQARPSESSAPSPSDVWLRRGVRAAESHAPSIAYCMRSGDGREDDDRDNKRNLD